MHKTKKGDGNHIASIKREIKKKSIEHNSAVEANTSSQVGKIFRGENESLVPKIEGPSSHAVSLSGNDSSDSSSLLGNCTLISHFLLRLFFCFFLLLLKVRDFEAERFTRLNFCLIEVRRESSSFCHLTHCYTRCLRSVFHLLYVLWCYWYR